MPIKTNMMLPLISAYQKPDSQLIVFYGDAGCGKEDLIRHFLQGKPHFYYRAREISAAEQVQTFILEVAAQYQRNPRELSLEGCFSVLLQEKNEKVVLVLDEFDHLMKNGMDFMEHLIRLKRDGKTPPVLILLCSSSIVFAERKMASIMGKSFYEIDRIQKAAGLSFLELVRAFPDRSVSECLELYSIVGGSLDYLKFFDGAKSVKQNICQNILSPCGGLFYEAERYLRTQLRELSVYNTVLSALALGRGKLNGLHQSTGFSRAKISVYLKHLMEFEVIEKVVSFETSGKGNAQKGLYRIRHTFLHFWFRFVFPYLSDLYRLSPEEFYEKHIAGGFGEYMEQYFVKICMEYLKLMNRAHKLPVKACKFGAWVGKQGKIDLIAQDAGQECIVGVCNWSKEQMEYASYEKLCRLVRQAKLDPKYFYFFSGTAFEDALRKKAAADPRVILVDMAEL